MPVWDLGGVWRREDISLPDYLSEDELDSLPALLLVLLLVAVLCIVYRFLRCRTRPRRKRQTRLRRLMTSIRVPAVWSLALLCTVLLLVAKLRIKRSLDHWTRPIHKALSQLRRSMWHPSGSWLCKLLLSTKALLFAALSSYIWIVCYFLHHKQHLSWWSVHDIHLSTGHTSSTTPRTASEDLMWTFVLPTPK